MNGNFPTKVEEAFKVIKCIAEKKVPGLPQHKSYKFFADLQEKVIPFGLAGFFTMLGFAILAYFFPVSELLNTTFAIGLLVQLVGMVAQLIAIASMVPFIFNIVRDPSAHLFRMIESSVDFDIQNVALLLKCDSAAISYILTYYEGERLGIEKRTTLVSGSLEKIGFFPAVAGLTVLYLNLSNHPAYQNIINILVFVMLAFHFLNIALFAIMHKHDRVISLLKYVVANYKALNESAKVN